ncbi:uncharacterized protein MKK02DRAFT_28660 [Dioszegia hungarica]|uniref:Uncharacterized protein n=1 Tax=Dioszegia hungarica TaxID=4972 RepID=A0AA38LR40_9TREE|nr:uncharacterized protein MKK02DRAFT_28660 [Dioszegia hungarica]KAI9633912.1 hypothetical protein MKK02DRAFT_28660 [Dioszegia hungarica]
MTIIRYRSSVNALAFCPPQALLNMPYLQQRQVWAGEVVVKRGMRNPNGTYNVGLIIGLTIIGIFALSLIICIGRWKYYRGTVKCRLCGVKSNSGCGFELVRGRITGYGRNIYQHLGGKCLTKAEADEAPKAVR